MPRSNGLPLDRHREIGLELTWLRGRLDAITAEVEAAWPRRTQVHELAAAATGPLDALRAELDARARIEHPDSTAGLYYPPATPEAVTGPEYIWRLRELMALRGMYKTSDLVKPLATRGITRGRTQIYRIVTEKPKQADIAVLLALCDILGCQLTDLAVPVPSAGSQK